MRTALSYWWPTILTTFSWIWGRLRLYCPEDPLFNAMEDFRDDGICKSGGGWEFDDVVENRNLCGDPNEDEPKWRLFLGSDGSSLLDQEVRLEPAGGNEESFDRLSEVVLEVDGRSISSSRWRYSTSLVSCTDFNSAPFGVGCGIRFTFPVGVTWFEMWMCSGVNFLSSSWVCCVLRGNFVSDGDSGRSHRRPLRSIKMIPLGLGVVGCTKSCLRGVVTLHGGETVRDGLKLCESVDPLSRGLIAGEEICWGVEELNELEEFRGSVSLGLLGSRSVISERDDQSTKFVYIPDEPQTWEYNGQRVGR